MTDWKLRSEIFYNFAVGLGAIGGGIFIAMKGIIAFLKKKAQGLPIRKIKKKYPREKMNRTFKLVDTEKVPGKVYLLDLKDGKRYWIQSGPTFLDLNFFWDDFVRIEQTEFDKYKEGTPILTSGDPGKSN